MPKAQYTNDEIVERGRERYEREVKQHVEPQHNGRFLALDVVSGDYDVDEEAVIAARHVRERHPDAAIFILRVGHDVAYRLGGRFRPDHT